MRYQKYTNLLLICSLPFLIHCKKNSDATNSVPGLTTKPNILLIIADDMGLDATPGYNIGAAKPNLPTISALAANGISFDNFWTNPVCSPTRASILTGKYGYRTGVLGVENDNQIPLTETSIQKFLDIKTGTAYAHAVIGKWHLSGTTNGGANNPGNMGVGHYAGFLSGAMQNYNNWQLTTNGVAENCTTYATTKFTDLAIDWVGKQSKPWFLWLAYTAPHTPFHLPPINLHNRDNLPTDTSSINADPQPYFFAMMEAMDTEIARLLASIPTAQKENTIIIFIGDNGSSREVIQTPYIKAKSKGTVYQGGICAPLIISGIGVSRKGVHETALINSADLFATIADVSGTGTNQINDSKSLRPLFSNSGAHNDYIYSEVKTSTTVAWTVRNETYKLIEFTNKSKEMYNLITDPYETNNLLNSTLTNELTIAKQDLENKLLEIRK